MYIDVAFNLPIISTFTYKVQKEFGNEIAIGKRVLVDFRGRKMCGFVVNISSKTKIRKKIKPILEVVDRFSLILPPLIELYEKLAKMNFCSIGELLWASIPPQLRKNVQPPDPKIDMDKTPLNIPNLDTAHIKLNSSQINAINSISKSIEDRVFETYLLHGVSGSGKTHVYIKLAEQALKLNRNVLVLVSQISLSWQMVERMREVFGDRVLVLHSRLLGKERKITWQTILSAKQCILVGARSAVLSPLRELGLIIIDEEEDNAYKQSESAPRYHAKVAATTLAKHYNATLILGSATPSVESYYLAQQKLINYINLPHRAKDAAFPKVKIVDLREHFKAGNKNYLSEPLIEAIGRRLRYGQKVILFINRRGYARLLQCRSCGTIPKCPNCELSLIYHIDTKQLMCHYCNYREPAYPRCANCKGAKIGFLGVGIQRVERELQLLFNESKIFRMDTDIARKVAHSRILQQFADEGGILLGTQMIAKGLDFRNVGLVGVVHADFDLNLPDFRAAERTFALLAQVIGRAGRDNITSEAIIQTYNPHHYSIVAAANLDYHLFYENEIISRKKYNYPPFSELLRIIVKDSSDENAKKKINKAYNYLKKIGKSVSFELLGPARCPLHKLKGYFRYHIIIKAPSLQSLQPHMKRLQEINVIVDAYPMDLL